MFVVRVLSTPYCSEFAEALLGLSGTRANSHNPLWLLYSWIVSYLSSGAI